MRQGATAAVVVAALLLAGCTGGGGGDIESASPGPSAPPSGATTVLIWSDPAHVEALRASAATHLRSTGVHVVVQTVGTDLAKIRDDITTLAPQGQGPDVFVGQSDWVGRLADLGLLATVDLEARANSFRRVAVDGFTYQSRTYGVPFATENMALMRNTELAPAVPESIEQMARDGLALAAKAKKDESPKILPIALPVGPQGDANHWYPLYSAAGGKIFGSDSQGGYTAEEVEVGAPGSIEAAEQLAALTEDGALDRSTTLDSALTAFTSGRAPFFITGPWSVAPVRLSGVPFVVEAVPGFEAVLGSPSQALVTSQGLMVSAFARNAAAAQQYLTTTVMTTDAMTALAAPANLGPAWVESYAAAASDPVIKGFGDYADASVPTPNLTEMADVWLPLSQAEVDVMSGDDPSRTMKLAGGEIQAEIDAG